MLVGRREHEVVVTTATGQIGGALTNLVLDAGAEEILLSGHPGRPPGSQPVAPGSCKARQDDAGFVTEALRGAQAMFWLTPPDYLAQDSEPSESLRPGGGRGCAGQSRRADSEPFERQRACRRGRGQVVRPSDVEKIPESGPRRM